VFRADNLGQTVAMNHFWLKSKDEFVAKLDNDCLITPGWLEIICQAHRDIERLGAVACWHYRIEDFDYDLAAWKIQRFGAHRIMRHPWVCGSGFVMKRSVFQEMGPWPEGSRSIGTTSYFLKVAKAGYINGWYYPLVLQEHQDDPLSPYCISNDDISLRELADLTYSVRENKIQSVQQRMKRREVVVRQLLTGSWNPNDYVGWRARFSRLVGRLTAKSEA